MTTVAFNVVGTPAGQGSKSAVVRGGKAVVIEGRSNNQRALHENWRAAVALAAHVARQVQQDGHTIVDAPLDGQIHVTARFRFQMPAARSKALRAHGLGWKTTAPDLDKLARALGDGLTAGGLIVDDRLIVEWSLSKVETTDWTGAEVHVEQIVGLP